MNKTIFILTIGILSILTSWGKADPNKTVDEGKVEKNTYTSAEIGWTIEIPKGWTIIDKEKKQATNEEGLKAIEETIESNVDYSGLKNLIGFQKNQFNIFQSTSELFELEYEGEWEENNSELKEILFATYKNQGIKADSSATSIEKIDGLDFILTPSLFTVPKEPLFWNSYCIADL